MGSELTTPDAAASEVRSRHGLGNAPIRDIIQVAEDFCGTVIFSREFPEAYEAFTAQDAVSGTTIIAVGISDNYERQRFTIAHELGHLESGRMSPDVHSLPDYERSVDEIWADNFARHLLLPISAAQKYLADMGHARGTLDVASLSDLVRVFGVSPKAAMIQLRDAKWISHGEFTTWWGAAPALTSRGLAVKYGWASERDAMVRASLTPRRPTRVVRAATAAYEDGTITLESLAQVAGESDLESFRTTLQESGVAPGPVVTDSDAEWETEDLSDLYRDAD